MSIEKRVLVCLLAALLLCSGGMVFAEEEAPTAEAAPLLAHAQQSFQPANKHPERLSDGKIASYTELPAGAEMKATSLEKNVKKEGGNPRLNRILFGSVAIAAILSGGLYLLKRFVWKKLPLWMLIITPLLIGFFCASLAGEAIASASTVAPTATSAPTFTENFFETP